MNQNEHGDENSGGAPRPAPGAGGTAAQPPGPQEARIVRRRQRPSAIWLLPLVAVLIGLSLVIHNWLNTGPLITIRFNSAEGLAVGKTQIQYKEVVIGLVEAIQLGPKGEYVLVKARLNKSAAYLANEESRFWVVRPRLGLGGVSGLDTLLSGSYIGVDAGNKQDQPRTEFVGLEMPPAITNDRQGKRFVVYASSLGSLDIGSPVYYRKIRVGRVASYALDDDGRHVALEIFIDAPNDRFVTQDSRFWNASGVNLTLNAEGLRLNTQSLATLIAGGVAFDRVPGTGSPQPAQSDDQFELYGDQDEAFGAVGGPSFPVRMEFEQSVRGLTVGSPIEFQGILLGSVKNISLRYNTEKRRFIGVIDGDIQPGRLDLDSHRLNIAKQTARGVELPASVTDAQASPAEALADEGSATPAKGQSPWLSQLQRPEFLLQLVNDGLRAQLKTANLLTGQMYISLVFVPKAAKVAFDPQAVPMLLPTDKGDFDQLQGRVSNIIAQLEQVPFGDIGRDLRASLHSVETLMRDLNTQLTPEARKTLEEAQRTLRSADSTLKEVASSAGEQAPLVQNANQTLEEVNRAARSLRVLADYLQANPQMLLRGRGDDAAGERGPARLPALTPTTPPAPLPSGALPTPSATVPAATQKSGD